MQSDIESTETLVKIENYFGFVPKTLKNAKHFWCPENETFENRRFSMRQIADLTVFDGLSGFIS